MAIVLSGHGSRHIDCRRTVYTLTTTATAYIYTTTTPLHQSRHRNEHPHLNHRRRHPRKHMVLLLFGLAVEGVDVTCSNAVYLYMIICGLNESFGLLMDTSDRSIIPDTSWCMKYCSRYLFPLYRSAGKLSLGVFKGERSRSREMPRRTNTVINSVPSQTALCSSNANEWHNANILPDSLWIT